MSSEYRYHSRSPEETLSIGKTVAALLKGNETIGITGDLGSGKTQFVKGICSYFDIAENEVSSPTFSLVNEYSGRRTIYHFDFYRITEENELWDIGIEDYLSSQHLKLIEWFELASGVMPPSFVRVSLTSSGDQEREIIISIP